MAPASSYSIASSSRRSDSILYRATKSEPAGESARPVLLKVPHSHHPKQVERLQNEFEIAGVLEGAAVLRPIALEIFQGSPALVLEDFGGETLAEHARGPMLVDQFLPLAAQIAGALTAVHERGVIHKNLKPDSILVHPGTGEVRLAELGIAALLPREQQPAHSPRLIEGALPYLAPEQTGWMNRAVDTRSDLYGLGVIFYQLLTGRLPFDARDPVEWVHCHIARTPVPPNELLPAVPPMLSAIVMKLLAKVAEERYQSARGLRHDLEDCHRAWRKQPGATTFVLGSHDRTSTFRVAQKLYGRDGQVQTLLAAWERVVSQGAPEIVLVAGYPGIGKSSLVNELRRPVVSAHGFFLAGKFDPSKRNVPYATLAQAFRDLVLDLLAGDESQVATWRERLRAALGEHGQVLVELVPQLELLLGQQPDLPELPQMEAQHRFLATVRRFVGAFARREHPMVLFLDDFQWADSASLALLTHLGTHPDTRHLLLMGAYRDGEVGADHPFAATLAELRKANVRLTELTLEPLSVAQLEALVSDTFPARADGVAPLARLVHEKTAGNPFFVLQFLTALHGEKLVVFDTDAGVWRWEVERIRAKGLTDNVVDLMVSKLNRLGRRARAIIERAACVSSDPSTETLALIGGCSVEEIHRDFRQALREGLVLRDGESYRFPHDRIRQAAHSLIAAEERPRVHLQVGRLLRAKLGADPPAETLFEVVNLLNLGAVLVTDAAERLDLARLNLAAARKARAAAAFGVALTYAASGAALLPEHAWETEGDLTFALRHEQAEGELVGGRLAEAERLLLEMSPRLTARVHKARVFRLLVDLYTRRGESARALDCASQCLALYGRVLVPHPDPAQVQTAEDEVWALLAGRPLESLVDLPVLADPDLEAAANVLTFLLPTAYFTDAALHRLITIHLVDLTLRHGLMPVSPMGFASYGLELCISRRYGDADRFGQLALAWVDRHRFIASRPTAYMITGAAANAYNRHYRTSLSLFRQAFEAGLAIGDLLFASFCSNFMALGPYLLGTPLDEVARQAESSVEFLKRAQYAVFIPPVASVLGLARHLRDGAGAAITVDGPDLDEKVFEEHVEGKTLPIVTFGYYLFKLQARYFDNDVAGALAAARKTAALDLTMRGQMAEVEAHVFCALALAAAHDTLPEAERPAALDELRAHREWLADKAVHCPENFLARHALVSAEIARLEGRDAEAMDRYEQAARAAQDAGLLQFAALANERCARFHLGRGRATAARIFLREARDGYERWGADYKVRALTREHPALLGAAPGPAATLALPTEQFDLLAATKASQAISGHIVLDELAAALVSIALEQGGAERGLLALGRDGDLFVEAAARLGQNGAPEVSVLQRAPLDPAQLPVSIARFAWRTGERVILDAEGRDNRFAADAYFTTRRPRSLLCLPIVREGRVAGLLYLENNVVAGAFTAGRLAALELLAAQAAISLENASLLRREQAARSASEAAERRAEFLAGASAVLAESLDYRQIIDRLARLVVGRVAEWCVIDVVEQHEIHHLAVAHADPTREAALAELQRRYPARWDSPHSAALVLKTGTPVLMADLTDAETRRYFVDDEHRRAALAIGTVTTMSAPIVARGRTLGAISVGAGRAGDRFGREELALLEELARRTAMAVDNAQLYRQAQEAARLRDEFLSVASHELNTPMVSLILTLQSLVGNAETEQPDRARILKMAELAERQGQRLRRLISDLLDVTRIERGPLPLRLEPVDLATLTREALARTRPELAKAGCEVSLSVPSEPLVGRCDPQRLDQVVVNVLSNAAKFGKERPVDIKVEKAGELARISVRDQGIGIDPRQQPHIFNRFARGVSALHYGGLGLGLYICRRIMDAHAGTISVSSEPGQGATFVLELPLGS